MNDQIPIRIVFIGLSKHAEEHLLPCLALTPGLQLTSVVSRKRSKALAYQQHFGAGRVEIDWQAAISALDIDAAIVTGPPRFHEEVAHACIARNLPVFVEKPCARDLSSFCKLAAHANTRPDCITCVGYNFRQSFPFQRLVARARAFGDIRLLNISFLTNKPTACLWDYNSVLESYLCAIAVHPIEMAVALVGQISSTQIVRHQLREPRVAFTLALRGASGTNAVIQLGNHAPRFTTEYSVLTDTGYRVKLTSYEPRYLQIERPLSAIESTVEAPNCWSEPIPWSPEDRDGLGYQPELANFRDAVRLNQQSITPIQNSAEVYRIVDLILNDARGCPPSIR